jgi:DNA-binding NarL/FixJ family response regulator
MLIPMVPSLLIVDDHDGFRSVVRDVLAGDGFDVTGEVGDGDAALAFVAERHPDVVLLDVQLPGMDGFEVARRLALLDHAPQVVLTSTRSAVSYAARLAACPARGFIPKQDVSGQALSALIEV